MKTAQDLLNFYGVELGKKYKITKNRNHDEYFVGWTFVVKEAKEKEELYLKIEQYDFDLEKLNAFDYEEFKEPLTDEERSYLSAVIKPFRDEVVYIVKKCAVFTNEYIGIYIKDKDTIYLPVFPEGKYYIGMEAEKEYTLKDLKL